MAPILSNHIQTVKAFARKMSSKVLEDGFIPAGLFCYGDETGTPVYWRVRCDHPDFSSLPKEVQEKYHRKSKWIRAFSRKESGGFQRKEPDFASAYPAGAGKKPLYLLPELLAAGAEATVYFCEGEPKANALMKLGLVATTSGGADTVASTHFQPLANRVVIIWPDNDMPGSTYAMEAAETLSALGCQVSIIDVSALNLPKGGDVIDWLEARAGQGMVTAASDVQSLKHYPHVLSAESLVLEPANEAPDAAFPSHYDENGARKSQSTVLIELAKECQLFHTAADEAYVLSWFPPSYPQHELRCVR